MVRKLVQARNLNKQRQTVSQKVVVKLEALPQPKTKRASRRAIGGKDMLLKMAMLSMQRPPSVISLNPAYNVNAGEQINSQLSSLSNQLNAIRDENARLRSQLEPKLIKTQGNIAISAPDDEATLLATQKVNENVNAMKEIMRREEELREKARRNAVDFMQDRLNEANRVAGKPATGGLVVFNPPSASELEEARMQLRPIRRPPPPPPPPLPPIQIGEAIEEPVAEPEPQPEPQPVVPEPVEQEEIPEEGPSRPKDEIDLRDDELEYLSKSWRSLTAIEIRKYAPKLGFTIEGDLRGKKMDRWRTKIGMMATAVKNKRQG